MQKHICVAVALFCAVAALPGAIPAGAQANAADKAAIEALYKQFGDSFSKKNTSAIMALYDHDVFVFDLVPPRQYSGWDVYKKDWDDTFAMLPGPVSIAVSDLAITIVGPVAYSHYIVDGTMTDKDGKQIRMVVRSTDVLRKQSGKWLIVQEHNSFPVDLATGQADMLSKP